MVNHGYHALPMDFHGRFDKRMKNRNVFFFANQIVTNGHESKIKRVRVFQYASCTTTKSYEVIRSLQKISLLLNIYPFFKISPKSANPMVHTLTKRFAW